MGQRYVPADTSAASGVMEARPPPVPTMDIVPSIWDLPAWTVNLQHYMSSSGVCIWYGDVMLITGCQL